MIVKVDADVFCDMLYERTKTFEPARKYSEEFWDELIFSLLKDMEFMSKPELNNPKYIIDNIAVNGDIADEKELIERGLLEEGETINDYTGDGVRVADYIVFNFGI